MDYPNAINAITGIKGVSKSFMELDAKIRHVTGEKMGFTEYTCFDDVLKEWAIPDYLKDGTKDNEKLLSYHHIIQIFFEAQIIRIAKSLKASKCRLSKKLKSSHVLSEYEITSEILLIRKEFLCVCRILLSNVRRNFKQAQDEFLKSVSESKLQ